MKITYVEKNFSTGSLEIIGWANTIITEYQAQGYTLTLRQLYYQMVARDLIENKQTEYKRVGSVIADGRLAGLIDWGAMEDRTRNVRSNPHWDDPAEILASAARQYLEDRWAEQEFRPEVWIEKDALVGVIEPICRQFDVPYFSCRGYTSLSEMWEAGHNRLRVHAENGQIPVIIHLGDHDPSGLDMTRDMEDRLEMFAGWQSQDIRRIALNMDQIEAFKPPPNFAKITDSRAKAYIAKYGRNSWELDALDPRTISDLIRDNLEALIDTEAWEVADGRIKEHRATLEKIAKGYHSIKANLEDGEE